MNPARKEVHKILDYSPGMAIEELKRRYNLEKIYKLASNENPLGPSPEALKVMQMTDDLHLYPEKSSPLLKEALAQHLNLKMGQVVVGNGADDLILRLAMTFVNPGEKVISGANTFSQYRFATELMGGEYISAPMNGYEFDLEAIKERLNEEIKIVFICNPNNPTGTIVKSKELQDFMKDIPKKVLVVFDEAYHEYVEDPDYPQSKDWLDRYPQLIILRTFSKIYGLAGMRVGYALCQDELAGYMEKTGPPFAVNRLAQKMALAALNDSSHFQKSQELVWEQKRFLYEKLEEMGLQYVPTEGNFLLVETGYPSLKVSQKLMIRGLIVRSGAIFGYNQAIRLTLGTFSENQAFLSLFREVLEELKEEKT